MVVISVVWLVVPLLVLAVGLPPITDSAWSEVNTELHGPVVLVPLLDVAVEPDPVFADDVAPLFCLLVFELVAEVFLLLGLVVELSVLALWALVGLLLG